MTLEKEKGVSSFPFCTYACIVGEKERNLLLSLMPAREGGGREERNFLLLSLMPARGGGKRGNKFPPPLSCVRRR